jgi:hypothetical protein
MIRIKAIRTLAPVRFSFAGALSAHTRPLTLQIWPLDNAMSISGRERHVIVRCELLLVRRNNKRRTRR